jgi:DNA modification methylase
LKPYYEDTESGIVIYHGDCREVLPTLPTVDLVLTDPPYGMNWDTDSSRFTAGSQQSQNRRGAGGGRFRGNVVAGDDQPFNPSPWLKYPKVILWGCNHFAARLPVGTTLVWVKRNDAAFGTFLSDAELAWMKGGHGVYCRRDLSMKAIERGRLHPTQKPETLMRWCIEKSGVEAGGSVLDPFMGSGTTLRAAKDLGRKAIGIEVEERYCEIAANRLAQGVLFGGAK